MGSIDSKEAGMRWFQTGIGFTIEKGGLEKWRRRNRRSAFVRACVAAGGPPAGRPFARSSSDTAGLDQHQPVCLVGVQP